MGDERPKRRIARFIWQANSLDEGWRRDVGGAVNDERPIDGGQRVRLVGGRQAGAACRGGRNHRGHHIASDNESIATRAAIDDRDRIGRRAEHIDRVIAFTRVERD